MCDGRLVSEGTRRARKRHVCDECNWWISPGETYEVSVIAFEGRMVTGRAHVECAVDAARNVEVEFDGCRAWLYEEIENSGEPLSSFDLQPATLRRLQERASYLRERHAIFARDMYDRRPDGRWADDGGRVV